MTRRRTRGNLLPNQVPKPASGGSLPGDFQAIKLARSLCPRRGPVLVCEELEVPAHGRLGKLEDVLQLPDVQLIVFQQDKEPNPDGIGESGQLVEDWACRCHHPYIRIIGYMTYDVNW